MDVPDAENLLRPHTADSEQLARVFMFSTSKMKCPLATCIAALTCGSRIES
jgi:hypothetical protein